LIGAKSVVIHMYNSTSPAQRKHVFGKSKGDQGHRRAWCANDQGPPAPPGSTGTKVTLQYSPESFSATEVEFAKEISEAVMDVWQPTPEKKMILNLPDTVEVAGPNVYADQIEWICTHIKNRESLIISLHTHNDRGTGTAATELGLLAGADRVEGTLFGNGERTGNLDIVQVAMNLYMHGIDPKLDFSDMNKLIAMYERCTGLTGPSASALCGRVGLHRLQRQPPGRDQERPRCARSKASQWDVPYLTIDPHDIGREYREVIRVNSQSGKGGVAYLLESEFGIELPEDLQREFGPIANDLVDALGREVTATELKDMFWKEYIERETPFSLHHFHADGVDGVFKCRCSLVKNGKEVAVNGIGNGPIAAFANALITDAGAPAFEVVTYREQSLSSGTGASALAFIQIKTAAGKTVWGAGTDTNIELASIKAVLSAVNRAS